MTSLPKIDSPILVLHQQYIDEFVKGKIDEIRGTGCNKDPGTLVFFSPTGGTYQITASTIFQGSRKLSQKEWEDGRTYHHVQLQERLYGDNTHAWRFTHFRLWSSPVPYKKIGGQIWRKYAPPIPVLPTPTHVQSTPDHINGGTSNFVDPTCDNGTHDTTVKRNRRVPQWTQDKINFLIKTMEKVRVLIRRDFSRVRF